MKRGTKIKASAQKRMKAPVRLSGGSGFRYENEIAARFLLDMLAGTNGFGADFGRITQVDWQASDAGWLTDDLALSCELPHGERRSIGLSTKSNQQVNAAGFPANFVDSAWGQWLGRGTSRAFQRGSDAIALVTAELPNGVKTNWSALLKEILQGAPERIVSRLTSSPADGPQASSVQRALFESFACPERFDYAPDPTETVRLLHDIRLLDFDFNNPTSQDGVQAIRDCQAILTSDDIREAHDLWDRLVGIADENRSVGGSLDLRKLLSASLRDRFSFRDHPDYQVDWQMLLRRTSEAIGEIETHIAGLAQLPRSDERALIKARLTSAGACLLVGESGAGKSALLKEVAEANYPRTIWLPANALDHDSSVDFERAVGLRHPLTEILQFSTQRCLIVFDGIENYTDRALRMAARIALKRTHCRAACRERNWSTQYRRRCQDSNTPALSGFEMIAFCLPTIFWVTGRA